MKFTLELNTGYCRRGDMLTTPDYQHVIILYMVGWRWYHRAINWITSGRFCKKPTKSLYKVKLAFPEVEDKVDKWSKINWV